MPSQTPLLGCSMLSRIFGGGELLFGPIVGLEVLDRFFSQRQLDYNVIVAPRSLGNLDFVVRQFNGVVGIRFLISLKKGSCYA